MRDNFLEQTKRDIAGRVNYRCSNPTCRKFTQKPNSTDTEKFLNLGEAAHIKAASPDGPRYDSGMTTKERKSANNGIWLCRECARTIDLEPEAFCVDTLLTWKRLAEQKAVRESAVREDVVLSIIDDIDIAINKLSHFLEEEAETTDFYAFDFTSDYQKRINDSTIRSNKIRIKYVTKVSSFIQDSLTKCSCVLGESDKDIIDSSRKFEASPTNRLCREAMLYTLQKLKTRLSMR